MPGLHCPDCSFDHLATDAVHWMLPLCCVMPRSSLNTDVSSLAPVDSCHTTTPCSFEVVALMLKLMNQLMVGSRWEGGGTELL